MSNYRANTIPGRPMTDGALSHLMLGTVRTLAELARCTGIPYPTLSGLNTGRVPLSLSYAERIATGLELRSPGTVLFPELVDAFEISGVLPIAPPPAITHAQAIALGERMGLHPAVLLWPELRAHLEEHAPRVIKGAA